MHPKTQTPRLDHEPARNNDSTRIEPRAWRLRHTPRAERPKPTIPTRHLVANSSLYILKVRGNPNYK
jgi:hypothetical protein